MNEVKLREGSDREDVAPPEAVAFVVGENGEGGYDPLDKAQAQPEPDVMFQEMFEEE